MEYTILSKDNEFKFACSTDAPGSLQIYNTSYLSRVDTPAETLEGSFSVFDKNGTDMQEGDRILFKPDMNYREMIVQEIEKSNGTAVFYAENAVMKLSNENALPFPKPASAETINYYLANCVTQGTDIKIGINEVSDVRKQLEYTGTSDKKMARLVDILNAFDAEAELLPEMRGYGVLEVAGHVLNIYKKKGGEVLSSQLIDGVNITSVLTNRSIKELRTCIDLKGAALEGGSDQYVNIINIEYDDGEYFTPKGASMVYSRKAMDKWLPVNEYDKGLLMSWSYDTEDANELLQRGINELKKYDDVQISFEIKGLIGGAVGNYITVSTKMLGGEMLVSARIVQKEICLEDRSRDKNTAGDFIQQENEIDETVKKLMDELKEINHQYTCSILSDNGTVFKNGEGTTCLAADVRDAGTDVTDGFTIRWSKDGAELATGRSIIVDAENIDGKSVYRFDAQDKDGKIWGSCEVTVSNVADGTPGKNGDPGENGVGIAGADVQYYKSSSASVLSDGEWQAEAPAWEDGKYIWTKTVINYTDGTSGTTDAVCVSGGAGPQGPEGESVGVTVSAREPDEKYEGMLWKHTGSVTGLIPNASYRWNGSEWELFLFAAENIDVNTLSAIAANLGTVIAGVIENQDKSVEFDIEKGEYISKDSGGMSVIKIKNDKLDYVRAYTNARYYGMRVQSSGIRFYGGGEELMSDIENGELVCGLGLDQEHRDLLVWSKEGGREALLIDTLIKLQNQVFKYGSTHAMQISNASENLIYGCWGEQFYRYPGYYGNGAPTDWAGVMGTFPISGGGYIKAALSADCRLYLMRQTGDGTVQQAWTAQ